MSFAILLHPVPAIFQLSVFTHVPNPPKSYFLDHKLVLPELGQRRKICPVKVVHFKGPKKILVPTHRKVIVVALFENVNQKLDAFVNCLHPIILLVFQVG